MYENLVSLFKRAINYGVRAQCLTTYFGITTTYKGTIHFRKYTLAQISVLLNRH